MGKRFITLAFILLLAGSATLFLGLLEKQKEKRQLDNIRQMLDRLENVKSDDIEIRTLAHVFSSDDWQQKLDQYNKVNSTGGLLIDSAAVFIFTASAILILWCLYKFMWTVRRRLSTGGKAPFISYFGRAVGDKAGQADMNKKKGGKVPDILVDSGWLNGRNGGRRPCSAGENPANTSVLESESPDILFSEKEQSVSKKSAVLKAERLSRRQDSAYIPEPGLDESEFNLVKLQRALDAQKKGFEKQIAEFQKVAESVKKSAFGEPHPLGDTIKELIQQVSAIREFAVGQQDRIRKLQEGYDWSIIKSFGLKVIRCIDNIEDKTQKASETDADSSVLQHIRDELVFALESSGIEQYRPLINSEYKGQERIAEAVKDRTAAANPEQKGKIAQVVRCGYRHFVGDENFRVIRTAKVKLYGVSS